MGAANVNSGLFQGITIDMSLSSTASGEAAGERTQLSSLVSAGVILAVVVFLAPLLRNLPSTVLGAIVLTSILGLFNFAELRRYLHQRKTDFVLALTALAGVVASDVMAGLMLAVLLSLVMLLYRASRPYIATLGRREWRIWRQRPPRRRAVHSRARDPAAGCAVVFLQCQCRPHADPWSRPQWNRHRGPPVGSRGQRRSRYRHVGHAARSDRRPAPGQYRCAPGPGARLAAVADASHGVCSTTSARITSSSAWTRRCNPFWAV